MISAPDEQSLKTFWITLFLISAGAGLPGLWTGTSVKRLATKPTEDISVKQGNASADQDLLELLCDSTGIPCEELAARGPAGNDVSDTLQMMWFQNHCLGSSLLPNFIFGAFANAAPPRELARLYDCRHRTGLEVEFLIVTLPDPIDSHLRLTFDNLLASLQMAIENTGYLLDRYSLPWRTWLGKSALDRPATYREQPGILVFRRQGRENSRLVVLIVGETSTAGVHRSALNQCLCQVARWNEVSYGSFNSRPIRILGPTFSGSSESIRQSLDQWYVEMTNVSPAPNNSHVDVQICTGSATADSNVVILQQNQKNPQLNITFDATVIPDSITFGQVFCYLTKERRIPAERIALISEAGTAYGEQKQFELVKRLKFPPQVGRLRTEYEKLPELRFGAAIDGDVTRRDGLPITFDDNSFAVDTTPLFSGETAAEIECELRTILSTISRQNVRVVVIVATDVNDILFLAKQVRTYSPDVQLIAIENDLLYVTADANKYVEGMLVASTYPLFANSQLWTGSKNVLPFPSSSAEGVYNAAHVLLIESGEPGGDGRGNKARGHLVDYHTPFASNSEKKASPNLWLTIAGANGIWPVQVWDICARRNRNTYVAHHSPDSFDQYCGSPAIIPALAVSLIGILCSLLVIASKCVSDSGRKHSGKTVPQARRILLQTSLWIPFGPLPRIHSSIRCEAARTVSTYSHARAGIRAATVLFVGMLFLVVQLSSPLWQVVLAGLRSIHGHLLEFIVLAVSLTSVGLSAAIVCWLETRLIAKCEAGSKRYGEKAWLGVLLVAMVGYVAIWWCPWSAWFQGRKADAAIFAERFGAYGSGVSPLVPTAILIVAGLIWALCHLRRLQFVACFNTQSPVQLEPGDRKSLDDSRVQHLAGVAERCDEFTEAISKPLFWPTRAVDWLVFLFVVFVAVYSFGTRWNGVVESHVFDYYFVVAAIVSVGLGASLFMRMIAVALRFEKLLRRFGQHPISVVLGQVPERLARKAAGNIFAAAPNSGDYEPSVRVLSQLVNAEMAERTEFCSHIRQLQLHALSKTADRLFVELRSLEEDECQREFRLNAKLSGCLAESSRILARALAPTWAARSIERGDVDTHKPATDSQPARQAELFVAIQLTHLVRQGFAHIQNLMTSAVLMSLLLLWSFNSYPFQPQRLILALSYGIVIITALSCLVLFIRFNQSEVLSRLSGSPPNQFTVDRPFIYSVATYVIIPLLGIAAVQFPEMRTTLSTWLGFVQHAAPM